MTQYVANKDGELDAALDFLRGTGTQVVRGADPNHGPMVVEALVALGRGSVAPAWADRYRQRLGSLPPPSSPITTAAWREALGAQARHPDWVEFFKERLSTSAWQDVLEEWLPRLVSAIVTA